MKYFFSILLLLFFTPEKCIAQIEPLIDITSSDKISYNKNDTLEKEKNDIKIYSNLFYNDLYNKFTEMSELTLPRGFKVFNIKENKYNKSDKYFLTAKINPTFFVFQNHINKLNITLEPNFTIRILNTKNLPINSPSYQPSINFLYRLNNSTMNGFAFVKVSICHHSNGHVDNLYNTDGSINTKSGRFATNYLQLSYNFGSANKGFYNNCETYKKLYLNYIFVNKKKENNLKYYNFRTFRKTKNYSLGIQAHGGLFNIAYNPELKNKYGNCWINYKYTNIISAIVPKYKINKWDDESKIGETEKEFHRFEFYFNYRVTELQNQKKLFHYRRINTELSWHQTSSSRQITRFISLGWIGSDSYNLYYDKYYWLVKIGMATNFGLVHKYKNLIKKYEDF